MACSAQSVGDAGQPRRQTFETAIMERYRRRDISIEEANEQPVGAVASRSVPQDEGRRHRPGWTLGFDAGRGATAARVD